MNTELQRDQAVQSKEIVGGEKRPRRRPSDQIKETDRNAERRSPASQNKEPQERGISRSMVFQGSVHQLAFVPKKVPP